MSILVSETKTEKKPFPKYKQSPYQPKPKADKKDVKEINSVIAQELAQKFKEYRELVQARKLKEAKSRKEPEVYHHFKK